MLIQISENGYQYTVLAPILLLVIVEFSSIAREIDLKQAVAQDHEPLILEALLLIVFLPILLPLAALRSVLGIDVYSWLKDQGTRLEGSFLGKLTNDTLPRLTGIFVPKLGRFSLIHSVNNGLLITGIYVTAGQFSGHNRYFSLPVLFFVALAVLPIFEVSEYDRIVSEATERRSYFIHVWLNFTFFFSAINRPTPMPMNEFIFWILFTSYIFLVALAVDIEELNARGLSSNTDYKGIE